MKKIMALALADIKNITRDSTLILVLFGTVVLYIMVWFLIPLLSALLLDKLVFNLADYYLLIICFFSLIPPLLFGMITGFIILEERDEEIITFIAVTPVRKTGYLAYKLSISMAAAITSFYVLAYTNSLAHIPLLYSFFPAIMIAMETPITALLIASFAENKVEGMAFGKLAGIMFLAPFIYYFVPSHWKYLAGILPPFWVTGTFFTAGSNISLYWLYTVIGLLIHGLVLAVLLKIFINSQR
ncbi:MAG TPA: hypothetical protein PLP19_10095 [bacterium]|nr:hypothetical protein [bacterium]HPN43829.1 hypothetical protein [bacterium]